MKTQPLSLDLRVRIVSAYLSGRSGTYVETAALFGVGASSVSRLLRQYRARGDVRPKPHGGGRARAVDAAWLRAQMAAEPDARLVDRVAAWAQYSGARVQVSTMWLAQRRLGWTHKKNAGGART